MLPALSRPSALVPIAIVLLAATALPASVSRIPDPVPVVKIRGKLKTEERGNMLYDRMKAGMGPAALSSLSGALGSSAGELGSELRHGAEGLAPGLLNASGLGDLVPGAGDVQDDAQSALDDLDDSGGLKTSTQDFEVTIAEGRMRMDQGTNSMIMRTDLDGDVMLWLIDHEAKRILIVRTSRARLAAMMTGSSHGGMDLVGPSGTESILGHDASMYTFDFETTSDPMEMMGAMSFATGTGDPAALYGSDVDVKAVVLNEGTAWLASGVDGAEEVAAFYRSFAAAMGSMESSGGLLSGFATGMADIASKGMPLRVVQETTVRLTANIEGETRDDEIAWTRSTSTIEGIDRDRVDDSIFDLEGDEFEGYKTLSMDGMGTSGAVGGEVRSGGAVGEDAEPRCDCSCDAFAALQEMSKDKKAMENNPDAMRMAMCARDCAMKWVACAR